MSTSWDWDKDLAAKKTWYSPVAEAYDRVRPKYPEAIVDRAIEWAQLPENAKILEIGCGPGTATIAFARSGFCLLCLEPSWEMCQMARRNCQPYPAVEIANTSFEEWQLEGDRFHAVFAASSFHWVSSRVRYRKAAEALLDNGSLILLWNVVPQPEPEILSILRPIYQNHAPYLTIDRDIYNHSQNIDDFGESILDSGYFQDLKTDRLTYEITYNKEDYLTLLGTLSPYLELEPSRRESLFAELRDAIEENCSGEIRLLHLCVCQVARKR
jgi:SAM-dependent methyltransferase